MLDFELDDEELDLLCERQCGTQKARPSLCPGLTFLSRADSAVLAFALALDLAVRIRVLADVELALALVSLLNPRRMLRDSAMLGEDELELESSSARIPDGTAHVQGQWSSSLQ